MYIYCMVDGKWMGRSRKYPPVSSNMASWKKSELDGGFMRGKSMINGPFSGTPCLITGG